MFWEPQNQTLKSLPNLGATKQSLFYLFGETIGSFDSRRAGSDTTNW